MKQGTEKRSAAERARAARRIAQLRREAEERVAAEEANEEGAESTPKRRKRTTSYDFTAEDITKLRVEQGLSWRQVAVNLELGGPSAARTAYTALTGLDYRDTDMKPGKRARSTMGTAKASTRKVFAPEWGDESDQDEIIERLTNARIVVARNVKGTTYTEEILVGGVKRLTWDGKDEDGPLCVHFTDRLTGGTRSVLVSAIKEVR